MCPSATVIPVLWSHKFKLKEMDFKYHDGVSFNGLARTIKLLESKHKETSIWSHRALKVYIFVIRVTILPFTTDVNMIMQTHTASTLKYMMPIDSIFINCFL
jgi:hypothetical protein